MGLALMVFIFGGLIYTLANLIHKTVMPFWYALLCYIIVAVALQMPDVWLQFELLSILGVAAMSRDLIKNGLPR